MLFATVWIGIWTPCLISAAWLFWVVTFGVDSSRPRPWRSSAVSAASRLKLPRMLPREIPIPDVKPAAGGHGGADPLVARDFVDMVLDGTEPLATPMAGRMSVAVGCAGTESIRNGSAAVEVPPVNLGG